MKRTTASTLFLVLILLATAGGVSAGSNTHFEAHLFGSNEVPANDSQATGQAVFRLVDGGAAIEYRLIVANLDNLTASHIHIAPAGVNGPVVAFLYGGGLLQGTTNGVLATGRITAADLRGPLAGQPLSALIDAMAAGNTYVNVHTTLCPGGEVRGQIK